MNKVQLNETDWQLGYDAGQRRDPNRPPRDADGLSWSSGYIEGKAAPMVPGAGTGAQEDPNPEPTGPRMR
ncbi:MAG: hypothetical protein LC660_07335 [Desulfobacteraceae bacterium]|nr:hypothetical protein [Desulfobacteraceae bacterium]